MEIPRVGSKIRTLEYIEYRDLDIDDKLMDEWTGRVDLMNGSFISVYMYENYEDDEYEGHWIPIQTAIKKLYLSEGRELPSYVYLEVSW